MSDYTKRFTILIKKDGFIESVVNAIGTYDEVKRMAYDVLNEEGCRFIIIKDQDVYDIVEHFKDILEKINEDSYNLWYKSIKYNKFKGDF